MLVVKKTGTLAYYQTKVAEVKDLVATNLGREMSISMLAEQTCISYHHLRDIFLTLEGRTLKQYINDYRIRKAGEILLLTNLTLDEVAALTGYVNKSTLSKAFKKVYRMSPGRFRMTGSIAVLE